MGINDISLFHVPNVSVSFVTPASKCTVFSSAETFGIDGVPVEHLCPNRNSVHSRLF